MERIWHSVKEELKEPEEGKVQGSIPLWLNGKLLRCGPGMFEVGSDHYNHLFDGLAIIHRFTFKDGKVRYQNKFLRSDNYLRNMAAKRIVVPEFGTAAFPDPCKSIFQRYFSYYIPGVATDENTTDNTSVNIYPFGDQVFMTTETNFLRRINPETLDTLEKVNMSSYVSVDSTTAHPHFDQDGTFHSIGYSYRGGPDGAKGPHYCIVRVPPPTPSNNGEQVDAFAKAELAAAVPCKFKFKPTYYHSFGMTENYYVFLEQPLFINVLKLLAFQLVHKPMLSCLKFDPEKPTKIHIVDKKTGQKINPEYDYVTEAMMCFHHLNAYEENGNIVLDICASDSAGFLFDGARVELLQSPDVEKHLIKTMQIPYGRRFVLPLNIPKGAKIGESLSHLPYSGASSHKTKDDTIYCTYDTLCKKGFDFPMLNYHSHNGKKYQYAYGVIFAVEKDGYYNSFYLQLIKVDVINKTHLEWREEHCFPSEPVFVPSPGATEEDEGVILSAVIDIACKLGRKTFLLVLDGKTFTELGRAEFQVHMPFNFHGNYIPHCSTVNE